jgi:tRNA (cmo5U34)-methyltransferase
MEIYDAQWAADYERVAEAAIPGRAGLYRLCGAALGDLPTPSRILVVGSGTGAELLALAAALPDATFVALEPAAAMRAACAERIAAAGLGRRIELLGTTLAAFACADQFDAATAVRVSQHCAGDDEAAAFFRRLSDLLTDGGHLYTADLHVALGQDRVRHAGALSRAGRRGRHRPRRAGWHAGMLRGRPAGP